jgi:hypothetical protein
MLLFGVRTFLPPDKIGTTIRRSAAQKYNF